MTYESPRNPEILEAYISKNAYDRREARQLKRALRKLALC